MCARVCWLYACARSFFSHFILCTRNTGGVSGDREKATREYMKWNLLDRTQKFSLWMFYACRVLWIESFGWSIRKKNGTAAHKIIPIGNISISCIFFKSVHLALFRCPYGLSSWMTPNITSWNHHAAYTHTICNDNDRREKSEKRYENGMAFK